MFSITAAKVSIVFELRKKIGKKLSCTALYNHFGRIRTKANPPEFIFHSFVLSLIEKTDSTATGYPLIVLPL